MLFLQDEVYCKLVNLVLNSEGGYVDNPKDPGGPTKYGIALNYNRAVLSALGVKNVRDLTYEQAKEIYYHKYYKASSADTLAKQSQRLAYLHFDAAVNHGVGQAAKFNTASKSNAFLYLSLRLKFYAQIKTFPTFGKGWTNRMAGVLLHMSSMPN